MRRVLRIGGCALAPEFPHVQPDRLKPIYDFRWRC
jgi:hypothetical protein